jgi:hypothetical protein
MTVKGIKGIMKQELDGKINNILESCDTHYDLINSLKWDLLEKLNACSSYDELETFCTNYYRMSLDEWVQSL